MAGCPGVERVQVPCTDLLLKDSYLHSSGTHEALRRKVGVQRYHRATLKKKKKKVRLFALLLYVNQFLCLVF